MQGTGRSQRAYYPALLISSSPPGPNVKHPISVGEPKLLCAICYIRGGVQYDWRELLTLQFLASGLFLLGHVAYACGRTKEEELQEYLLLTRF